MKVRTYGFILLGLAGIVPLAFYGIVAIERSRDAAVKQVRESNQDLAEAAVQTITAHLAHQRELLTVLGTSTLGAADTELPYLASEVDPLYEYLQDIVVYRFAPAGIERVVGIPPHNQESSYRDGATRVWREQLDEVPMDLEESEFSHLVRMTVPLRVVGRLEGVIVARYDMVGIWLLLRDMRFGNHGFVRLISAPMGTVAHGHPDVRGVAFGDDGEDNWQDLLAGSQRDQVVSNHRGERIVVTSEEVDTLAWAEPEHAWYVLVEQPVSEAFATADAMRKVLLYAGLGALLLVGFFGVVIGRTLVRALERLRQHTRALADRLDARLEHRSRLLDVQELADSLGTMASALAQERDDARRRERVTTFGRVAAGLAHDLRLPIEVVRGACAQVVREPDDAHARRLLERVAERELVRLKRYVDDLQRLARHGELALVVSKIDPANLAEDVMAEVSGNRKWSGVDFSVRGSAGASTLDRDLIRRALLNLVSNAADACVAMGEPGHGVVVEVGGGGDEEALEFRVIDTGTGMDQDTMDALEASDFQSTKRVTGVGLGLGVVRQIADAHGGELTVESELGRGSVFTLRVPPWREKQAAA